MEKVIRDDYVFDIDIEKAKGFYSDAPKVFDGLSEYLPELTCFMASLGIDIEKPVKYDPDDTYVSVVVASASENVITIEAFGIELKKSNS